MKLKGMRISALVHYSLNGLEFQIALFCGLSKGYEKCGVYSNYMYGK
jgi:hypothetical protein